MAHIGVFRVLGFSKLVVALKRIYRGYIVVYRF